MKEFIYKMVDLISSVHERVLDWNYSNPTIYSDKELHFWVMGFIGIALLLVVYPLFLFLAKRCVLAIAGLYVFTLMFVIAFAIEIEQGLTGTGVMDFGDAVSGLRGFMWMFVIFAVARFVLYLITKAGKAIMGSGSDHNAKKAQRTEYAETRANTRREAKDNNSYEEEFEICNSNSDHYNTGHRTSRRYRPAHAATFHSARN